MPMCWQNEICAEVIIFRDINRHGHVYNYCYDTCDI